MLFFLYLQHTLFLTFPNLARSSRSTVELGVLVYAARTAVLELGFTREKESARDRTLTVNRGLH